MSIERHSFIVRALMLSCTAVLLSSCATRGYVTTGTAGDNLVYWIAKADCTINVVAPANLNSPAPLLVSVSGNDVTVTLGCIGDGSPPNTTSNAVRDAVNGNSTAFELLEAISTDQGPVDPISQPLSMTFRKCLYPLVRLIVSHASGV
jgi:hypothetical protein